MAWTAPTTRSTGDLITASIWNVDLVDNLSYLKTEADKIDDISQSVPSRAAGTTYQNTTSKFRLVTISVTSAGLNAVVMAYAQCDSNSSPSTYMGIVEIGPAGAGNYSRGVVSFMVPPNYYYKLTITTGILGTWTEWDLH